VALWNTKIPSLVGSLPMFTGATIFEAKYGPLGEVTDIWVDKQHTQLGLSASDDIDALAIGKSMPPAGPMTTTMTALSSSARQYVFSLNAPNASTTEQLMVHATISGQGPATEKLRTETGNPLVGPTGTLGGDVKGACGKDPEALTLSSGLGVPDNSLSNAPVMSLSLHAQKSLVQPTDVTPPPPYGVDSFDLTGVLSGWGTAQQHDALVFVAFFHQNGMIVRQLPSRTSQQDVYEFAQTYLVPWPGPGAWNYYRVAIGTLGTSSGSQNLMLESMSSWLLRKP